MGDATRNERACFVMQEAIIHEGRDMRHTFDFDSSPGPTSYSKSSTALPEVSRGRGKPTSPARGPMFLFPKERKFWRSDEVDVGRRGPLSRSNTNLGLHTSIGFLHFPI
jgi:hypothetical protein